MFLHPFLYAVMQPCQLYSHVTGVRCIERMLISLVRKLLIPLVRTGANMHNLYYTILLVYNNLYQLFCNMENCIYIVSSSFTMGAIS